jgi:hypothetical protein
MAKDSFSLKSEPSLRSLEKESSWDQLVEHFNKDCDKLVIVIQFIRILVYKYETLIKLIQFQDIL